MKKITVITVNYNNASGLEKTVLSIISQIDADFEFIIIDGHSTDQSKTILEKYNSKINYWVSETDTGIYDAMNKGVKKASGEYLLFINSGDQLFENDTLSKAQKYLDSKTDIVYGDLMIEENGKLNEGFMPDEISLTQMMKDTLWHPVSFIKKEVFNTYGPYDTSFRICGDYDFFFKTIIAHKVSTKHIKQFISVFYQDGVSSNAQNIPLIQNEKERTQKTYLSEKQIEAFWKQDRKKNAKNFWSRWFQ